MYNTPEKSLHSNLFSEIISQASDRGYAVTDCVEQQAVKQHRRPGVDLFIQNIVFLLDHLGCKLAGGSAEVVDEYGSCFI